MRIPRLILSLFAAYVLMILLHFAVFQVFDWMDLHCEIVRLSLQRILLLIIINFLFKMLEHEFLRCHYQKL